jgi:hypothetical protein
VWTLAADPARAVPFLVDRLRGLPAADPQRIAKLVADLEDTNFQKREAAAWQLEALGKLAEPTLRATLAGSVALETRRRIEKVLARREAVPLPPEMVRAFRAMEALEHSGTPEARQGLEAVARHATEPYLRHEATAVAERLRKRGPVP